VLNDSNFFFNWLVVRSSSFFNRSIVVIVFIFTFEFRQVESTNQFLPNFITSFGINIIGV